MKGMKKGCIAISFIPFIPVEDLFASGSGAPSIVLFARLDNDSPEICLVSPTSDPVDVADMAVAFLVGVTVEGGKSARERDIRERKAAAVLIRGFNIARIADISRVSGREGYRRRTYRAFLNFGH
jgi:hypothetical protein